MKVKAKKYYGQNFLQSKEIIEKMVSSISYEKDLIMIEIGPGQGVLTKALADKFDNVDAYEIDESLKEILEDNIKEYQNINITYDDFLNVDLSKYQDKKVAVCANLPYYITSPILFKLFKADIKFESITVMMQKEVGLRFMAKVGSYEYNDLSVIGQYLYDISKVCNVSRNCFNPVPKVDSVVLQFKRKDVKVDEKLFKLIEDLFAYRRKTLLNNYEKRIGNRELALKLLNEAGIDEKKRAQECSINDFLKIYEVENVKR